MRLLKTLIRLLVTLSILLAVFPQHVQAAACSRFHVVQTGEDIGEISQMYGVSWKSVIELNQLAYPGIIFVGQNLCITEAEEVEIDQEADTGFTFDPIKVYRNNSVTVNTTNIPANETFHIFMGANGSNGIDGIWVGDLYSGNGGSLSVSFPIPDPLFGSSKIAIRMENDQGNIYYDNWFNNVSGSSRTIYGSTSNTSSYVSFSIVDVAPGRWVTIHVKNARAHDSFYVIIGKMGTKAANGVVVGGLRTGSDGTAYGTFPIPGKFSDNRRLAIRIESENSGSYFYNWFDND